MRFSVIGTDAAGLTIDFTIDARNADEAEHMARQRGINVAKVWIGTGSTAPAGPGAAPMPAAPVADARAAAATQVVTPAMRRAEPAPQQTYTRAPARPRINLGLVSLALGGTAMLFCWIPTVSVISWPLCAVGAIAGLAGLAGAFRRAPSLAPSLVARLAPPVCGLGLSALTIAAGAVFAGATEKPDSHAAKPVAAAATVKAPDASSAPDRKPRNMTIVGSEATGNQSIDKPAAVIAPPVAPAAAPPVESVKLGAAELRAVSCEINPVPLIGDQGRNAGITALPLLVVRVEIKNTGDQPIEYSTLAGDEEAGLRDGATLKDDQGRTVRRAQFGFSIVPAGRTRKETLGPGKSVTDVLAFERPSSASAFFTLDAPGRCVGTTGSVKITVPGAH